MSSRPGELEAALHAGAIGNRAAPRLIFDREAGRLVAIAERIVRRRDLVEDVVQDVFRRI